jgi:hypothetical protein
VQHIVANLQFLRIAAEVGIKRERDEVFRDEFRINFCPGEPPGMIGGASASRPALRTAIRSGKNHDRFIFRD